MINVKVTANAATCLVSCNRKISCFIYVCVTKSNKSQLTTCTSLSINGAYMHLKLDIYLNLAAQIFQSHKNQIIQIAYLLGFLNDEKTPKKSSWFIWKHTWFDSFFKFGNPPLYEIKLIMLHLHTNRISQTNELLEH